ncbi:MAG: hypothetical protein LC792_20820, partial [Actinobacteria bacterium]|nr:hypothetical protein [Actinomycetota bacterium]
MTSASCSRRPSQAVGRLNVTGRAQVDTAESGKQTVTHSRTLRNGETVSLLDGSGTLSLGSGRQLELRKGTVVRLAIQKGSTGKSEPRGELVSGDVLLLSTGDAATLVAGETTVQVTGIARISRGLAVVVAVYQGSAGVDSAGNPTTVAALRQVTVPAPGLPSRRTPLVFTPADSWDQRYLGDAIDLGNQLVARSRGFSAQLSPGDGTTVDFYRRILPDLAKQPFDASLLDANRMPGETLVGAAITLGGTRGDFRNRWESVFGFHDEGAPWGLVALAQGVDRGPLLATVDAAIGRVPGLAAQPATPAPSPSPGSGGTVTPAPPVALPVAPSSGGGNEVALPAGPGGTTTPGPVGTTGTTGSGTGSTGTSSTPAPNTTPPSESTRGAVDLGIPIVDDTLNAVVDTLSGLLRAISIPG